ncbi:hypothetical protein HPB50_021375 [Hyalomma asiaticum]|uniref:Uncharacterized protein n=1 Tax=Hyalomma asiaticum TaxID=266040 RepID=A0ACB7T0H5_HYAAI|nr:hypothetical protein HPB50_021375 [Hyalomma asiaticum]
MRPGRQVADLTARCSGGNGCHHVGRLVAEATVRELSQRRPTQQVEGTLEHYSGVHRLKRFLEDRILQPSNCSARERRWLSRSAPRSGGYSLDADDYPFASGRGFKMPPKLSVTPDHKRKTMPLVPELSELPECLQKVLKGDVVITNAQQFLTWFSEVEERMMEEGDWEYTNYIDVVASYREKCCELLGEIDASMAQLRLLQEEYEFVSNKTNALHEACEHLLDEQSKLMNAVETIAEKLRYFTELDTLSQKMASPDISVLSETFIPMLTRLDECISYLESNPQYKEAGTYLVKFKHMQWQALEMIRSYVTSTLEHTTHQVLSRKDPLCSTDNSFALLYGKFRTHAPRIHSLVGQIEERVERNAEYRELLDACHTCYFGQRETLLGPSVSTAMKELAATHQRDHCALVRSGCAFLVHLCEDEHQLYMQFFTKASSLLDDFLSHLCGRLYDVFRPIIIHTNHLETLAELCSILKSIAESLAQNSLSRSSSRGSLVSIGSSASGSLPHLQNSTHSAEKPNEVAVLQVSSSQHVTETSGGSTTTHTTIAAQNSDATPSATIDGELFQIKHLLILREQIAPFQIDFAIKETSLDFTRIRDAALSLYNKKSRLFSLGTNNALLEFVLEGSLSMKENLIDSKKAVDNQLKALCEEFIANSARTLVGPLQDFLDKANLILQVKQQEPTRTVSLRNQPFAAPEAVGTVVSSAYRHLKSSLNALGRSMSLYLANKDTEQILFKPIKGLPCFLGLLSEIGSICI